MIDRWEPRRGGGEAAMAELARELERGGDEVVAFARSAAGGAPGKFQHVRLPLMAQFTRAQRERALARELVAAARAARCDRTVAMRHVAAADVYWPHGGSHAASLEARARMGGAAGGQAGATQELFLELERELLDRGGARCVVCVSTLVREELAGRHPGCRARLELVPNGVDLERFHPRNRTELGPRLRAACGVDASTPLIAFVARDPELKGLPALLDALETAEHRKWHLVVAGPRRSAVWAREARRRGLGGGRVTVRTEVDPQALFAAADLCVHPSWRDACGLVVLEALASGVPVVTTKLAGASEAVSAECSGSVLPDPSRPEAIAAEIGKWLDRIERGELDRDATRACVLGRGREPWLARMCELVRAG